jgi:hypothetical protein
MQKIGKKHIMEAQNVFRIFFGRASQMNQQAWKICQEIAEKQL